jgi:hypothetical protein
MDNFRQWMGGIIGRVREEYANVLSLHVYEIQHFWPQVWIVSPGEKVGQVRMPCYGMVLVANMYLFE